MRNAALKQQNTQLDTICPIRTNRLTNRPFCTLQTFQLQHIILPSTATSPKCSNHIKFSNKNLSGHLVSPSLQHARLFTSRFSKPTACPSIHFSFLHAHGMPCPSLHFSFLHAHSMLIYSLPISPCPQHARLFTSRFSMPTACPSIHFSFPHARLFTSHFSTPTECPSIHLSFPHAHSMPVYSLLVSPCPQHARLLTPLQ